MNSDNIIQMGGSEWWGDYIFLVTAGGNSLMKIYFDKRFKEGCCEFGELNTHPDFRRQGFAKRLMQEAEKVARSKGYEEVWLWTKSSSWQQKWYERMGYKVETAMRPPSSDTIWLSKALDYERENSDY